MNAPNRMSLVLVCAYLVAVPTEAAERFDKAVRDDFFAGIAGDAERFQRGMKTAEQAMKANAANVEAKVWYGAGQYFSSNVAFRNGDFKSGQQLMTDGLKNMADAVRLEPDNVRVRIPRGATLIAATRFMPAETARPLLKQGVDDYEAVLALQQPTYERLSTHSKGELLLALADGWRRLDNNQKAREYFARMQSDLPGTVYERKARAWLDGTEEAKSPAFYNCSGCHKESE